MITKRAAAGRAPRAPLRRVMRGLWARRRPTGRAARARRRRAAARPAARRAARAHRHRGRADGRRARPRARPLAARGEQADDASSRTIGSSSAARTRPTAAARSSRLHAGTATGACGPGSRSATSRSSGRWPRSTTDERAAFLKGLRALARRADGRIRLWSSPIAPSKGSSATAASRSTRMTPSLLQPSSVDVRVDRYFRVFHNARYPFIDVKQPQEELTEAGRDRRRPSRSSCIPASSCSARRSSASRCPTTSSPASRESRAPGPPRAADPLDRRASSTPAGTGT